jgi:hypothetical protein
MDDRLRSGSDCDISMEHTSCGYDISNPVIASAREKEVSVVLTV